MSSVRAVGDKDSGLRVTAHPCGIVAGDRVISAPSSLLRSSATASITRRKLGPVASPRYEHPKTLTRPSSRFTRVFAGAELYGQERCFRNGYEDLGSSAVPGAVPWAM